MVTAVRFRARTELRARWRAWLALAVVAGVAAGVVLGALGGAAATQRAYRDFARSHQAADVVEVGASPFGLVGGVDLDKVVRFPEVADSARASVAILFS